MSKDAKRITIPDDLAACQALIEQLASTVDEQSHTIGELTKDKQELKLTITELLQRFQRKRERYVEDPNQLHLDFGDTAEAEVLHDAVEEMQTIAEHTRRRQGRKKRDEKLPDHLPRYEVEAEVPDELKNCPTHGERKLIGYDTTESLEFERPKLRIRVTKYPKYVCENAPQCGIASPNRPASLIEGDRYGTSIAAQIITGKYGFHMPIYRQQDFFAGSGWIPARSTLLNIVQAAGELVRPLVDHFKQVVLESGLIGTDDTRVTLLLPAFIPEPTEDDPKSRRIHEVLREAVVQKQASVSGRMWAYRSITIPINVFDFTVSRHRDGPDLFLQNFIGKLMADCYSGYQKIDRLPPAGKRQAGRSAGNIQRAACCTHARRKVFDAVGEYPLESSLLLAQFQQLYDIEDRAKLFSPSERLVLRSSDARPVWQRMQDWLASGAAATILPKSNLGKALGYIRNHWDPLRLYLTDGLLPMDNNDVEQLMKQVALGRKNLMTFCQAICAESASYSGKSQNDSLGERAGRTAISTVDQTLIRGLDTP